ncbi:hypothetical protein ACIP3U_15380 [[Kitasatospora] papulosa]|uniref:hypothetical protein n=1 Tax=[Kitasatospora] papulosa TaxID=1464011 RepID=UPI003816991C
MNRPPGTGAGAALRRGGVKDRALLAVSPTDHVIRRSPVMITAHALNLNEPPAALLAQTAALAARTATPARA